MTEVGSEILKLVREALDELDAARPLSAVIRKAIRIARLRNDYEALWWLQLELVSMSDDKAIMQLKIELASRLGRDKYLELVPPTLDLELDSRQRIHAFDH